MSLSPVRSRFAWFVDRIGGASFDREASIEGFSDALLEHVPAGHFSPEAQEQIRQVLERPARVVDENDHELAVIHGDVLVLAAVESPAPHRFTTLAFQPAYGPVDDERLAAAPWTEHSLSEPVAVLLRTVYREYGMVGVVAAEFDDRGQMTWSAAGGFADLDDEVPMTVPESFLVASITKLFTAVVVLQLVDAGVLGLDDVANAVLSSLRVADDRVTILDLLVHTDGLTERFSHLGPTAKPAAEVLGDPVVLDREPGLHWRYGNAGYGVLGQIVEDATGHPFEEVLQSRLLDPLGMRDSALALSWPESLATGYEVVAGAIRQVRPFVPTIASAGGLCTTAPDLGRFAAGWQSMLSPAICEIALRNVVTRDGGGGQGLGWSLESLGSEPGSILAGHSGSVPGYCSSLLWSPAHGRGTVILANRSAPVETINRRIRAMR